MNVSWTWRRNNRRRHVSLHFGPVSVTNLQVVYVMTSRLGNSLHTFTACELVAPPIYCHTSQVACAMCEVRDYKFIPICLASRKAQLEAPSYKTDVSLISYLRRDACGGFFFQLWKV